MNQILLKPIITEKSLAHIHDGTYAFEVARNSNKPEIVKAIENLYKVKITKINLINLKGERKLVRQKYPSKIKAVKKAIIHLKKGQKIPGFEE